MHKKYEYEILAEESDKTQHHQPTLLGFSSFVLLEMATEFLPLMHFEPFLTELYCQMWKVALVKAAEDIFMIS